jgi:hypothetical protein
MASSLRLRLGLLLAAVLCLAAPLSAGAATTRYASPAGTGAAPCAASDPCSLEDALSNAEGLANGDTVLLAPGTYEPAAGLDVFRESVTVAGEPGAPAPLIKVVGARGLSLENPGTVRDLRIHAVEPTEYALAVTAQGSVIERVESTGEAAAACGLGEVTVRDTVCAATGLSGTGIFTGLGAGSPITQKLKLVNVTAIGGFYGIVAQATVAAIVSIEATNTIAVGDEVDVEARTTGTASATVTLGHSNFATTNLSGSNTSISSPGVNGNQEAAPQFVDEPGGNYRELPDSPTRLTGDLAAVLPGELDLAGNPRTTNCAGTVGVDIGAYQYECPPPPGPPIPPPNEEKKSVPAPNPALPILIRPVLSKLALKPGKFTDTGKAPRGTTISYSLSEAATVKLEVLRTKTVKGKKKTVVVGSVPRATGKAGKNSVKFSGKLKGEPPLEPGKYTLRAVATAAGVSSVPATVGFEVRIP